MKQLVLALAVSAVVSTAYAAKDVTSILHCGCTEAGNAMVYRGISVSKNSKGHMNHVATSTDSCLSGVDADGNPLYTDYVRTGDDCALAGVLEGLTACADFDTPPVAGDDCGAPLVQ